MDDCLNQERAQRYLTGNCSGDEHQAIETHLTKCKSCRQRIESIQSNTSMPSRLTVSKIGDEDAVCNHDEEMQTYVSLNEYPAGSMSQVPSFLHNSSVSTASMESMIEGYKILERLPLGGQAVVYKAVQEATKRVVALKVLLQGPHISTRAQSRFEREVDLAASLKHPNIVTIYDSGIAKGQYYFAMEYVVGKPLDEYVQAEKLSLHKTMELFNKVCSAVAYAHQRGVIHRDLKPGNILADAGGEPHVLDFGLAKLVDGSENTSPEAAMVSIPGKVIGTLAFMSPEQASGQPDAIDVRTDVYSIGIILYEILTGTFPYDVDGSMLSVLRNIQETEPTRPSRVIPHLNSEVEAIIMRALDKDLSYRYQSVVHLQQDIDHWLNGLPIAAKSDSSIYLLRKIITRHRYASAIVALLLVIVAGFSCVCFQLYHRYRKTNITLESTVQSLNKESAQYATLALKVSFADFLKSLHAKQFEQSRDMVRYFSRTSKEMNAALFLLDQRPLTEKAAGFRNMWEESEPCFVEFIIAEHHLKDDDPVEAAKAYRRCLSHEAHIKKNRWLAMQVKSRLYELDNKDQHNGVSLETKD